jgi:hypothetical protein
VWNKEGGGLVPEGNETILQSLFHVSV